MNKMLKSVFELNEYIIVKLSGWKHIPYSRNNFMYFVPHIYKGKPLTLSDGTKISRGDRVAELHIDNLRVGNLDTRYTNLLRLLQDELSALKRVLKKKTYTDIKAVYGISVFHDIARRQGFTIKEMDGTVKGFLGTIWENILRVVFKKENKKDRGKYRKSKECWLSAAQIMEMNEKNI